MKEFWDDRFRLAPYAYGKAPNTFFKNSLDKYNINGRILLPAEGEGRNAVFAAEQGCEVVAFDISEEGKKKALQLAKARKVHIDYTVGNFLEMEFNVDSFDAVALIYAHFPPNIRSHYHEKIVKLIKPNGMVIFEAFSENHLPFRARNPKVGGPNQLEMLFSIDSVKNDFSDFELIELEETETELNEGDFHVGKAMVIRFIGRKLN
jgi:cyclopropane fatty-acyl-phospholipid synthase-like methyltransferase